MPRLKLHIAPGVSPPRVHDLRHSFAEVAQLSDLAGDGGTTETTDGSQSDGKEHSTHIYIRTGDYEASVKTK